MRSEFSIRFAAIRTSAFSKLVEEFILPFALDEARPHLLDGDYRLRALLQLASEEAKHIQLFKTFKREFAEGFGTECAVIGPG
jgi:hypothetical protein